MDTIASVITSINRNDFGPNFLFGAGTSALQIEGAAHEGGRGPSIWDTWTERTPEHIMDGSGINVAINSYNLFKDDVKILKHIGFDVYRFSISWSRILPGGKLSGGVNKEGIKYYNDLINELIANGIQPFVTLFHWDVPQALEDEYRGFLSDKIVKDFADFCELCFWEFGDRVKNWVTLNEPWSFSNMGYSIALLPPGRGGAVSDHCHRVGAHLALHRGCIEILKFCTSGNPGYEPYIVTHNLLLAHAEVVKLYRDIFKPSQKGQIGIVLVTTWMEPYLNYCDFDKKAAVRALDFVFGWYMEPLMSGKYPKVMVDIVKDRLPEFSPQDSEKVKGSFDFLGVNYYTASYVKHSNPVPGDQPTYNKDWHVELTSERNGKPIGEAPGSSWLNFYPEGIFNLLKHINDTYFRNLQDPPPIYITENGCTEKNNPKMTLAEARVDKHRITFYNDHLQQVLRAKREEKVNVKGYIAWSLLDNFELAEGFTVRFGIVYVDTKNNYLRYPKVSAMWWKKFLSNGFHTEPKRIGQDSEDPRTKKRTRATVTVE